MPRLYAIPTFKCNMCCPHCFINDGEEIFNEEKFMQELNQFNGEIVLFGGEPTYDLARMMKIIAMNKKHGISRVGGVTTNLIVLTPELIEFYRSIGGIATSWNKSRFSNSQYKIWKENCKRIHDAGVGIVLLVTLTEDLIHITPNEFIQIASEWADAGIQMIRFEYYIGDHQPDYYTRVDEWLYQLACKWNLGISVEMFQKDYQMYFDCNSTYTLTPDGILHHCCPNGLYARSQLVSKCLICPNNEKCFPCKLQEGCSYPKKLRKYIEMESE